MAPRHEYLRAFRQRLEQAAAIVRARDPAALVVVVLDAADNSVYAANLTKDDCFVSDLMMEAPPEGCRIVALARPNRTKELAAPGQARSEEHTSELQSLMRISYAVFCLKKKTQTERTPTYYRYTSPN